MVATDRAAPGQVGAAGTAVGRVVGGDAATDAPERQRRGRGAGDHQDLPAEVLDRQAAERRTDGDADHRDGDDQADRPPPQRLVVEEPEDQRHGAGRHQSGEGAAERADGDELPLGLRGEDEQGAQCRSRPGPTAASGVGRACRPGCRRSAAGRRRSASRRRRSTGGRSAPTSRSRPIVGRATVRIELSTISTSIARQRARSAAAAARSEVGARPGGGGAGCRRGQGGSHGFLLRIGIERCSIEHSSRIEHCSRMSKTGSLRPVSWRRGPPLDRHVLVRSPAAGGRGGRRGGPRRATHSLEQILATAIAMLDARRRQGPHPARAGRGAGRRPRQRLLVRRRQGRGARAWPATRSWVRRWSGPRRPAPSDAA